MMEAIIFSDEKNLIPFIKITLVSRLKMNAALFDFPPERRVLAVSMRDE